MLQAYLGEDEWQHLQLASLFVPQDLSSATAQQHYEAPEEPVETLIYTEDEAVKALAAWTGHGRFLFDVQTLRLEDRYPALQASGRQLSSSPLPYAVSLELQELLAERRLSQFIGSALHYQWLERQGIPQLQTQVYQLMLQNRLPYTGKKNPKIQDFLEGAARNYRAHELSKRDWDKLWEIELSYYQEEVLGGNMTTRLMEALKRRATLRLQQYLQYGLFDKKRLVCRVMLNCYGLHYWQIGGVFTTPEYRGRGLATMLTEALCYKIHSSGRRPVLFVRKENKAAMRIYQKLGFETLDQLVMAQ